jgi:hypothetical protein
MATRKKIILSSLLLYYFIRSSFSEDLYFEKLEFHNMDGNSIETTAVYDDFQCMLKCKGFEDCSSINLADQPNRDGLYECVLLRNEAKTHSGLLNPNKRFHHYTRVGVSISFLLSICFDVYVLNFSAATDLANQAL